MWVPDYELIQAIADEMVSRDVGRIHAHDSVERIGRCFDEADAALAERRAAVRRAFGTEPPTAA